MSSLSARAGVGRSGFRNLKVVAKVRESTIITSFLLEPVQAQGWRPYQPGQFLVFRIPVSKETAGAEDYMLRNYSVSGSPSVVGTYRISVKREAAPAPGLPAGVSSCFLHDQVEVGDVLSAEGPRGDFVLDTGSSRPVVLLSGGVGLTPMVSMLHALASTSDSSISDRRVVFIHACENGDVHALRDEVSALAATRPEITVHFCYRSPTERDRSDRKFHSEGLISREMLQRLLPLDDYDFYLCGPPPFMQAVYALVRQLGVPKARIAYEFFGPATVLDVAHTPAIVPPRTEIEADDNAVVVEFRKSGIKAVWDGVSSLLEFAEEQGLEPEFSCRAGVCSTCKSRLIGGEVSYFEEPLDELEPGEVLLCCSKPLGSVVLDI